MFVFNLIVFSSFFSTFYKIVSNNILVRGGSSQITFIRDLLFYIYFMIIVIIFYVTPYITYVIEVIPVIGSLIIYGCAITTMVYVPLTSFYYFIDLDPQIKDLVKISVQQTFFHFIPPYIFNIRELIMTKIM